jgi:glycosyltransferase involved in cell wall biosynthesis
MLIRRREQVLAAARLLFGARRWTLLAKNLAVFPKSLWLADLAVRHKVEHIHAHWASTTATMAMIASKVSGVPWSFTAHRGDIVADNMLKTKVREASFVRVIAQSSLRLIERVAHEAGTGKTTIIHMGVPVPDNVRSEQVAQGSATVLCPAHLWPVKGHAYLLQAIATLKERGVDLVLHLAGNGGLRPELEKQAAALGVSDRVRFLGRVSHDEIVARYRDGQVGAVVLPSVDLGGGLHEGIPVALIEAMSYGVPVVSTTTGGIPELLGGGAGVLVPPADSVALADAVARVIQDPSLRARLSQSGRNRVIEQFSVDRTVEALRVQFATSTVERSPFKPSASERQKGRRAA